MQKLFIETKYSGKIGLPRSLLEKLPEKIVLALPVQFLDFVDLAKTQLEKAGKKVLLFQSRHGKHPGQILGCDVYSFPGDYDAFFYVGDGKFHPAALLYGNKKTVYCYNPFTGRLEVLAPPYLDLLEKQKQGRVSKFLASKRIGLLITSKPGQNQTKIAEELRKKLEAMGKEVFVFQSEEINFSQLENFNFVECWVNTACPRIVEDFNCLNWQDFLPLLDS